MRIPVEEYIMHKERGEKRCSLCREWKKKDDDFPTDNTRADKKAVRCKYCAKEAKEAKKAGMPPPKPNLPAFSKLVRPERVKKPPKSPATDKPPRLSKKKAMARAKAALAIIEFKAYLQELREMSAALNF